MPTTVENRRWERAQKGEAEWWEMFITKELNLNREQLIGFRNYEGRFWLSQFVGWHDYRYREQYNPFWGKVVLDVGCGPMSFFEKAIGFDVVAIDPLLGTFNEMMPEIATIGWSNNVLYVPGTIDVVDGKFDIIWCCNVLDHIVFWQVELVKMRDRMAEGGELYLSVDCRPANLPDTDPLHPGVFTGPDVLEGLRSAGLTPIWWGQIGDANAFYRFNVRASRNEKI